MKSNPCDRRNFLRRALASSAMLPGFARNLMGRPGEGANFAQIRGTDRCRDLLEDAFSIYGGRPDGNTLAKMVVANVRGTSSFVNDNVWWKYTDSQCNYHATYGWRPFFNKEYRKIDRDTWQAPFRFQVNKQIQEYIKTVEQAPNVPPLDWLPYSFDPSGLVPYPFDAATDHPSAFSAIFFYSNIPFDMRSKTVKPGIAAEFAENADYPLMNCITATDYLLWERDIAEAKFYLSKIDAFLEALRRRCQDSSGLLLVGTQGSQIEFAHYGFRYPGHTHVYLWKVYRNMQHAARMAGRNDLADQYADRTEQLERRMQRFIESGKWFVGGLKDGGGQGRLGTGRMDGGASSYLDVWHNVNAVVLHLAGEKLSQSIVEKIASVPALTANHLTLVNYPARPREEIVPHPKGFPQPGVHVNGGWMWMCAAGALYAYTRTRRTDLLDRLGELLSDHHQHYSIDYYNQYGANKGLQWPEHGHDSYSVTCAGSFGMMFRALLGLQVTADSLEISPRLPRECESLATRAPVLYGGKELLFSIRNGEGAMRSVWLNGKAYHRHSPAGVTFPYAILDAKNLVEIEMEA